MVKIIRTVFVITVSLFAVYISLLSLSSTQSPTDLKLPKVAATAMDAFAFMKGPGSVAEIDSQPFHDNPNLYQSDDPGSVVTMYVTVRKGNSSDHTDFTWSQIT